MQRRVLTLVALVLVGVAASGCSGGKMSADELEEFMERPREEGGVGPERIAFHCTDEGSGEWDYVCTHTDNSPMGRTGRVTEYYDVAASHPTISSGIVEAGSPPPAHP